MRISGEAGNNRETRAESVLKAITWRGTGGMDTFSLATLRAPAIGVFMLVFTAHAATLDTVKKRGTVICGANGQLPGLGLPDVQGNWTCLDVDLCRAIAAAIFSDTSKVKFVPLTARDRFSAPQIADVDVLARNTTWASSRDTQLGLNATGINYYDG
jgi:ABC-type amino acid transport substrate-binding protein